MDTHSTRSWQRSLAALIATALAACGGGGGGGKSGITPPAHLSYSDDETICMVDLPVSVNAPAVTGQVDVFTISPALPAGLALDPLAGAISGTPTALAARRKYTVSATNGGGVARCEIHIAVVAPPRFAYVVSETDSTISIFTADATTGKLHHKGYVATPAGEAAPEKMTVHPSGAFAFVPNQATSNVSVYAIDPDAGWLTALPAAPAGIGPHRIALGNGASFLYLTNQGSNEIRVYQFNDVSGELTPSGAPVPTGVQPSGLAIDPTGRFLFVSLRGAPSNGAGGGLQVFAIDPLFGSLSPTGNLVALTGAKPSGVSVDPVRPSLYVTLEATNSVLSFFYDVTTGALTQLQLDPTGVHPSSLSIHPNGRFTYVVNTDAASISCFSVDSDGGNLSPVSTVGAGTTPSAVTVDPSGRFAYVVNRDSRDVIQYAVNETTGDLTVVDSLLTRAAPSDLEVVQGAHPLAWIPRFIQVANFGTADVSAFNIDVASGIPTESFPVALAGAGPSSVATDPRGRFAYVANQDSQDITVFAIAPVTGALTADPNPVVVDGHPMHITIDPSGRFLYVVARDVLAMGDGYLAYFSLDATSGALSAIGSQPVGGKPTWVGCEPTGQFVYVANSGGTNAIASYRIDAGTGVPTASAPPTPAPGVFAFAFHPNGRWAHAALRNSNVTVQYTIDVNSGQLVLAPGGSRAGREPSAIAYTPNGRFAYVAYQDSQLFDDGGHVSMFVLDATGHLITPATSTTDGLQPIDLSVDPSGRFLYVANYASHNVSVMTIDAATGLLTIGAAVPTGRNPRAIVVSGVTH